MEMMKQSDKEKLEFLKSHTGIYKIMILKKNKKKPFREI